MNLCLEGRNISKNIQRSWQVWYHSNADAWLCLLNNSEAAKCLKKNHGVLMVGQVETVASYLDKDELIHWNECECNKCIEASEGRRCEHPHTWFTKAKEILDTLDPKWRNDTPEDTEEIPEDHEDWKEFDTRVTTNGTIDKRVPNSQPKLEYTPGDTAITATVAGVELKRGEEDASNGTGIVITSEDGRKQERGFRVPRMCCCRTVWHP
jgi:hypothetical protein